MDPIMLSSTQMQREATLNQDKTSRTRHLPPRRITSYHDDSRRVPRGKVHSSEICHMPRLRRAPRACARFAVPQIDVLLRTYSTGTVLGGRHHLCGEPSTGGSYFRVAVSALRSARAPGGRTWREVMKMPASPPGLQWEWEGSSLILARFVADRERSALSARSLARARQPQPRQGQARRLVTCAVISAAKLPRTSWRMPLRNAQVGEVGIHQRAAAARWQANSLVA
ncbi:hypothetical protein BC834DRAFT_658547 [Gloeopeniophorella convolvens]|nr:hypothetical protein BC834DRAFT_658547 [Gloeopeniophorella convolvens]